MKTLLVTLSLFSGCFCLADSKYVLIDHESGWRVENLHLNASQLGAKGNWGIQKRTLHGGTSEGVDVVTVNNGKLKFTVVCTRGMSVLEVVQGDIRLGWDSPVEEIVNPAFMDLESRGGLGWLEGFNEWMVRCGLEYAGHPGTDELPGGGEQDLTLHGKIGNIPASKVEVIIEDAPPHRIHIRGTVFEKFFYGPKLKLVTDISTVPGSNEIRISDTLTNEGGADQEFQLIYHGNYGSSILEEGAVAVIPAKQVAPMDEHAGKALDSWPTYTAPTQGFQEEVFLVEPLADADGNTLVLLKNKAGDLGTTLGWNIKELPYFTQWKNTTSRDDGYVTGLEPATGYPYNRKYERRQGRVPTLAPGASRSFTLDFAILDTSEAVETAEKQVQEIIDGRSTQLLPDPPVVKD